MRLNVFKDYNCWSTRYKLTHPWKIIIAGCRNLKAAWQRATRGFANRDTYNLDFYLLHILPATIRYLAKTSYGWPQSDEFPEFEDWQNFLFKLAEDFEKCQDPKAENRNEYYEEYMKQFDDWNSMWEKDEQGRLVYKPKKTEIDEKYFSRAKELSKEQQTLLEDAFSRLGKHIYGMWN